MVSRGPAFPTHQQANGKTESARRIADQNPFTATVGLTRISSCVCVSQCMRQHLDKVVGDLARQSVVAIAPQAVSGATHNFHAVDAVLLLKEEDM